MITHERSYVLLNKADLLPSVPLTDLYQSLSDFGASGVSIVSLTTGEGLERFLKGLETAIRGKFVIPLTYSSRLINLS